MGRGLVISPAVGKIGKAFRMNLPFHGIRLPIPRDGNIPPSLFKKETGQKRGISIIAQDHVRIEMFDKPLDFSDIDHLHFHAVSFTLQNKRSLPNGVSFDPQFQDPKVGKIFVVHPHRFGGIRVNFKDPISLNLNYTSACWKDLLLIKVSLRQRDVTIVEGDLLLPGRENSGELGIMLRIDDLDLHDFHFLATPELPLSVPLVSCCPPLLLERAEEIEKIGFLSLRIEPRPERIFESARPPIFSLDPQDHRGVQRIEIEEPSVDLHVQSYPCPKPI
jgi:hypothetical protein